LLNIKPLLTTFLGLFNSYLLSKLGGIEGVL
jgi:hypothetical protein